MPGSRVSPELVYYFGFAVGNVVQSLESPAVFRCVRWRMLRILEDGIACIPLTYASTYIMLSLSGLLSRIMTRTSQIANTIAAAVAIIDESDYLLRVSYLVGQPQWLGAWTTTRSCLSRSSPSFSSTLLLSMDVLPRQFQTLRGKYLYAGVARRHFQNGGFTLAAKNASVLASRRKSSDHFGEHTRLSRNTTI